MDGARLIPENGRFAAPTQSVCKMAKRRAGKRYIRAIGCGILRFLVQQLIDFVKFFTYQLRYENTC
jgi:hypothetical protein